MNIEMERLVSWKISKFTYDSSLLRDARDTYQSSRHWLG